MVDIAKDIAIAVAGVALYAQGSHDDFNICLLNFQQEITKASAGDVAAGTAPAALNGFATYLGSQNIAAGDASKIFSQVSNIYANYISLAPCDVVSDVAPGATLLASKFAGLGYDGFPAPTC